MVFIHPLFMRLMSTLFSSDQVHEGLKNVYFLNRYNSFWWRQPKCSSWI